jgi:hypothetical protein
MPRRFDFLRSTPALLFFIVVLSYGIVIPWLGLYGDDWIYIYNYHLLGAGSFGKFVAIDRPFSAWIYVLTTALFQTHIWMYHVLLVILRWLSAVLVWWVLRLVWPEQQQPAIWTALLFAVYPGFVQQPIAVQFILHFAILDLFLFSIGSMLLVALQPERSKVWLALGLFSSLGMFSLEYFVGLELIRPLLLWLGLQKRFPESRKRLRTTILFWLPFLVVLITFGVWRVFIFKFPTYQPQLAKELLSSPLATLPELMKRVVVDLKTVTLNAWRQVVTLPADRTAWKMFAGLVVGSFALVLGYLLWKKTAQYDSPSSKTVRWFNGWPMRYLLVGLFALLVAGLPLWPASIRVELPFPWDRSTLPFMLGSCMTLVGLCGLIIQPEFQVVLIAALVALSIGHHYDNSLVYKTEWQNLRTYFQQMAWRMPGLQTGTILASDEIPLYRYSDNDLTPVVNWIYSPNYHVAEIPYKYFDLSTRVGDALPGVEEGLPVVHEYRGHTFHSTTSSVLAIYYRLPGCLWVLGPEDASFPKLPERIAEILPISHKKQVLTDSNPPAALPDFLSGPAEQSWCYYFEKTDLAVQKQDWQAAVNYTDEAFSLSLEASDPIEYLPALEGYAHLEKWEKAGELTHRILENSANQPIVCNRLKLIGQSLSPTLDRNPLDSLMESSGCNKRS